MGIIIKQSIKGSIWSYLGVAIGFVTTAYLFPNYLSTDTIGLFGLLLSWSLLFAQFSSLGFHGVTSRLFPYFRDKSKGHNGYLFIAFAVILVGFLLFYIFFDFFKPYLVESNLEKSKMFSDYIDLLIPLTFFSLLFVQLDTFNKLLYNAVFGIFLQEFLQRILIFSITLLFVLGVLNLHQLILAYAGAVCIKGIVLFFYLLARGEINFRPQLNFIYPKLRKEMVSVAAYSILSGLGGSIVFNIDKILVNQMLGLSATGIYTIAFFFGTLVIIPSRPLLRITGTLIADAWKKNDLKYISDVYKKSCLNQFIIGAFLFGGLWINIDNILTILGPDYEGAKWVIFFIGLAYLIDMATGANAHIIAYSKYYKVALYFILILIVLVVASMFFLIKIWGITGGAIAIALSFAINNLIRFVFLRIKFKLQPFNYKFLLVFAAFFPAYVVSGLIPELPLVWNILAKSCAFSLVFGAIIIGLNVSSEANQTVKKVVDSLLSKLK
ncbi:Membrane protein involved in the export of O-antigen and teichoic acid [Mariniphaga anaerophila]|uniref:Membrane protein involved in the export of O-antigen and teichoic acid n=1 Tax=Mariniphaga anaerophila TaxID=1484053 RepID=A0A1M5BRE6_9BACT|nr:oligosaccharide flippase family protein [Mariniphaga anaerophila]SHF44996.1 Membrane protein involved in the export of O-antigen and teichoic acid [Mariniphaga anaerophila]